MAKEVVFTPGELLGYAPTEFQAEFHRKRRLQTYTVFVAHRRFGKTESCLAELINGCLRCSKPAPNYKYIAPTLKQAKEIAWSPLMKMISRMKQNGTRGIEVSRTDARVVFNCAVNAPAVLQFSGLEEPDNLRGGYDDGMIVDEAAGMKAGIWGEILVPRLADRDGWAVITGTVKGMDQLYDFYTYGCPESDKYNPHWGSLYFPVDMTRGRLPWLGESQLEKMAAGMGGTDSIPWRQEMDLDWLANDGSALIALKTVTESMKRQIREDEFLREPNILGVDTSGYGGDDNVLIRRQGRMAFPARLFNKASGEFLAGQIVCIHRQTPLDAVFVDCTGGYGFSTVEALRRMIPELRIYEINFSHKALDPEHFLNRRAEMWDNMRAWTENGCLPNDEALRKEMSNVHYEYDRGRLKLEDKDNVKKRLGRSPDRADALALTFAYPVAPRSGQGRSGSRKPVFARDDFTLGID